MKTTSRILLGMLLLSAVISCKKKDDCDAAGTTATTDTIATADTTTVETTTETGKLRSKHPGNKKLTSAEIDSIKAERDKIVTPPNNTGASATPGSGRAVPGNDQTVPGTNASQSSSTGIDKK